MSTEADPKTQNKNNDVNEDIDIQVTKPSHEIGGDNNNSSHHNITASNLVKVNQSNQQSNQSNTDIINENTPNNNNNKSDISNTNNDDDPTKIEQKSDNPPNTSTTTTSTTTTTTPTTSNKGNSVIGKKRKRATTRWGPPPRKKRWGTKQINVTSTQAIINNLLKNKSNTTGNNNNNNGIDMFSNAWNEKQTKIFLLKNQFQDVSTRLIAPAAFAMAAAAEQKTDEEEERSPSPEPIYDQKGIRINTREYRLKEKLQKKRISIIQELIELDSTYQPPPDYKAPKLTKKIMMPVDEYPDYNFFGLIVGPRGNTQKEMQKETGCKIAVRGQGACIDKPGRLIHPDDNEPLHVHVTAPNQESMDKAVKLINKLLIEVKEGGGEHKQKQLRELATLNGTLRIESRCRICGGIGHPIYKCPERTGEKWTPADIQCKICGELTHVTEDCKFYKRGKNIQHLRLNAQQNGIYNAYNSQHTIDQEYSQFMQELVGDGPISSNRAIAAIEAPKRVNNVITPKPPVIGNGIMNGFLNGMNYHNVPPPNQPGVAAPSLNGNGTVNGNDDKKDDKKVQVPVPPPPPQQQQQQYHQIPPNMPFMPPNPYAMGGMGGMGGFVNPYAMGMGMGIRPPYPMPMGAGYNPYAAMMQPRHPMHMPPNYNPYMQPQINPYTQGVVAPPYMQQNPYATPSGPK